MTLERDNSAWFLGEFGFVVPTILLVLAIYYGKKGRGEFGARKKHNKSLQVTFDPPPTFAAAKAVATSNAP